MDYPKTLYWICNVPIAIPICVLGIIGNAFSVFIWNRIVKNNAHRNSSTAIYLLALGASDTAFILTFFLTESLGAISAAIKTSYLYCAFYSWVGYPMFYTFLGSSIWIVVAVTINRWVLITFPIRGKDFYTNARTYLSVAVIFLVSLTFNIHHFFIYRPKEEDGQFFVKLTTYGSSGIARKVHLWCHCVLLTLLAWLIIFVFNLLIIKRLKQRTAHLTSKEGHRISTQRNHQMTIMLLAITFTFLLFLGWQCITSCMLKNNFQKENDSVWENIVCAYVLANLGLAMNASLNCIFYCFSGTVFRHEFEKFISPKINSFKPHYLKTISMSLENSSPVIRNAAIHN